MRKRLLWYGLFFILLIVGFWFFLFRGEDLSRSKLPVISDVQDFSFINQDGKRVTDKQVEGKVYVVDYFFTTCKAICPRMNANMRRVYDAYEDEPGFRIISHSCMPETDSVPLLKAYEAKMINGVLQKSRDGSYTIAYDSSGKSKDVVVNNNWDFVTGDKSALYKMARNSYKVDNNKPDSTQNISDQFIHTQFFALVDKQRRVRGIYDGLKEDEIQKLLADIQGLLKEKETSRSLGGFGTTP